MAARKPISSTTVSVILPVFNEAQVIRPLVESLEKALGPVGCKFEIIFVNDGSRDDSPKILDEVAAEKKQVRVIHFSRNFGHQAAVKCGLEHATGDAIVVMDSDMQDKPEAIASMLEKWQEGYDVIYAIRTDRKEGPIKRFLFTAFYRFLNSLVSDKMPNDAGNFGLIDSRVAAVMRTLQEEDRYYAGLRNWVGFKQIGVTVERGERYDKTPRVSMWGLVRLARSAIFSFSTVPLMSFYVIAFVSLLVFIFSAAFTLGQKLFTDWAVPGWTSTVCVVAIFGFINSLGIAILGEYIWRIYAQVRQRPTYVIDRKVNMPDS